MSEEERRTVVVTTAVLLFASLLRFGWEARPIPPILPAAEVPAELIQETRRAIEREARMNTPLGAGEQIDPNRDPDVELARLPGIGPALAARIVASREAEGAFRQSIDLLRVSGIGPVTLERIRPHLNLAELPGPVWPPRTDAVPRRTRRSESVQVDLNRATAQELEALPALGPALSSRIVEYRARMGPFGSIEDLGEVPGIGPAAIEQLRRLVQVRR